MKHNKKQTVKNKIPKLENYFYSNSEPKNRTTTITSLGFDKIENLTGIKLA